MSSSLCTAAPSAAATSHRAILLFLPLALMSALLNSSVPTPLYPHYQQALALSDVSLTLIYGGYAGGVLISLFGVGNLAGRVSDLRAMILPALLAVLGGALLFSLADSFWSLLLARVLAGIGTGALTGAANVALLRFGPRDGGKQAALSATLSFTAGLALGPVFSGLALQLEFYPTQLPFLLIMGLAACAMAGVALSWPARAQGAPAAATQQGRGSLGEGLKATGAAFFICALALFTAWAVAASLLAIGPKVASQLLGLRDLGLFGYLIAAYMVLTLLVNRQTPATPDTHYTGTNGVSVYYDSSVWSVCRMTEDATLGTVLELATADTADSEDYQAVLLQRGTADSYESFIEDSEADLKQAYGVIKPRKVNLTVEGAAVEAVRCDIRTYYAVLATITYDSGDVVYVSALTKLASISDVVNLVESVSLS